MDGSTAKKTYPALEALEEAYTFGIEVVGDKLLFGDYDVT